MAIGTKRLDIGLVLIDGYHYTLYDDGVVKGRFMEWESVEHFKECYSGTVRVLVDGRHQKKKEEEEL